MTSKAYTPELFLVKRNAFGWVAGIMGKQSFTEVVT